VLASSFVVVVVEMYKIIRNLKALRGEKGEEKANKLKEDNKVFTKNAKIGIDDLKRE
jgi:hypothetical protein